MLIEKTQGFDALERRLASSRGTSVPGLAIVISQAGRTIYHKALGLASLVSGEPIDAHTVFDAGSITKTVTGLAIAILEEGRSLTSADPIRAFLPTLPSWADPLRIEHLLHHESGLLNYTSLLYYMAGWHEHAPPSSTDVFETIRRSPGLSFAPGTRYAYCDSNYFLLARIVECVSSERFGRFAQRNVFHALGMKDSSFADQPSASHPPVSEGYVDYEIRRESPFAFREPRTRDGFHPTGLRYAHVGAEGLQTSVTDLVRLGQHILSPSMITPRFMRERVIHAPRIRDGGRGYGYGLNVGTYRGLAFVGHDGAIQGFTGSLAVFPEEELVIACVGNRGDIGAWELRESALDDFGCPSRKTRTETLRVAGQGASLHPGRYMDDQSASFLEIVTGDEDRARLNEGPPVPVNRVSSRQVPGEVLRNGTLCVWLDGEPTIFSRLDPQADPETSKEYEGTYTCEALLTAFEVVGTDSGIRLVNADPQRPSMDLDYTPTIPDFFWSHDPHPGVSQIQFRRSRGQLTGFIYRDYDGDGREALVFVKD